MPKLRLIHAMRHALQTELRQDPDVFILGVDVQIGVFGPTRTLVHEFGPERIRNTPISEAAITGMALGAAANGKRPVVDLMMANFFYVAMDQLINQASKLHYMTGGQVPFPVTYISVSGPGTSNAAQHSDSVYPMLMSASGLKVVMPSTPYDAAGLLRSAIRDNSPVVFFQPTRLGGVRGEVPEEEYVVPIGQAAVRSEGSDITLVGVGVGAVHCEKAAQQLAKDGVSVEVIDLRSLVPLDLDTVIASVRKTGKIVVVEEARRTCGVGAEIVSRLTERLSGPQNGQPFAARIVAAKDVPAPYSPPLEKFIFPTVEDAINAAQEIL